MSIIILSYLESLSQKLTTVIPRFTAPRFTVNPDLPHLQPFPQSFTRIFTFLSCNHVILCKEGFRLPSRHQASLPRPFNHMHALLECLLGYETLIRYSLYTKGKHVIRVIKTPIYRTPRFTAHFSLPPNGAVNRGFTVLCSFPEICEG